MKLLKPLLNNFSGCKYQDENTTFTSIDYVLTTRVLRLVAVLLESYNGQLKMESEIFLTLLIKFCEVDKLPWQRKFPISTLMIIKAALVYLISYFNSLTLIKAILVQPRFSVFEFISLPNP